MKSSAFLYPKDTPRISASHSPHVPPPPHPPVAPHHHFPATAQARHHRPHPRLAPRPRLRPVPLAPSRHDLERVGARLGTTQQRATHTRDAAPAVATRVLPYPAAAHRPALRRMRHPRRAPRRPHAPLARRRVRLRYGRAHGRRPDTAHPPVRRVHPALHAERQAGAADAPPRRRRRVHAVAHTRALRGARAVAVGGGRGHHASDGRAVRRPLPLPARGRRRDGGAVRLGEPLD